MHGKNSKPSRASRKICLILITLTLCVVVSACSQKQTAVVITPQQSLMQDCPIPQAPMELLKTKDPRAYAAAASSYIALLTEALKSCNGDKAALRKWSKDMGKEN